MDRVHADRVIRWISAAALVVSAALSATGCGQDKPSASEAPTRPPAMVTVAVATSRQMPIYLDRIGKMVAMDSVTIVPQVGGKIIGVHFEDGASVKKGDLLFQIDPRPFQAVLDATQAELAQNKAQLDLARDELKRYGDAVASSAVSEMEFKQKTNAAAIAEARVAAGQAATETAKLNLEFASIYSPIDGRAGARLVDPGNVVTGNLSQLLVIQRLDPIYAEFTVNENDLGAIRSRLPVAGLGISEATASHLEVRVEVPSSSASRLLALATASAPATMQPEASAHAAAGTQPQAEPPSPSRMGKLTFVDNAVQSESGTVKLRATMPNADRYFWPGQFVNVKLVLSNQDTVLVPAQAQQLGQQGPYVYVINDQDVAELRPVVLGQRQGAQIAITHGLQAGERVVMTGHGSVMPSSKVAVTDGKPHTSPSGGDKPVTLAKDK